MTSCDVPDRDMPSAAGPGRPGVPFISDASLTALLAGSELPPDAAPQLRSLAEVLAELARRPAGDELTGEAGTLTAFRDHFGAPRSARHVGRNRGRRLRPAAWPIRAAAAAIVGLGGLATAAYAGTLPASLQRLAHDIVGAPAPRAQPAPTPSPAIPGATAATASAPSSGPAAGQPRPTGTPATPPTPRGSGKPTVQPTPRGSGKPSALPTPRGSGKPSALPTPRGSGKPAGQPTPYGSGKTVRRPA